MTDVVPESIRHPDSERQENAEIGRSRIRQIFRFLKDFNGLRNPVRRQISEQPWALWVHDLPSHTCVWLRSQQLGVEITGSTEGESGELLLRVRRPDMPKLPAVPSILNGWLPINWKDPAVAAIEPLSERRVAGPGGAQIEKFDAVEDRIHVFAQWRTERDRWATEALPAQQALDVFNRLYELQGRLEREGESVQLVLGQGILSWRRDDGDIHHPIVVQRLQLSFDPFLPEFKVSEIAQPPELIRPLLFVSQDVAAETIQQADDEIAAQDLDLLDADKMEGPLRRVASALHEGGRFTRQGSVQDNADAPQISCDPVIYLHRRSQGFAIAIDHALEDLQSRTELPSGLLRVSGIDPQSPESDASLRYASWEQPAEILFTKEANDEQFRIAARLERYGNVLVQGPPGTGKTHTIANLIGHLLAHGKKVLVTALTSKALRVLRDKVVEPLQTLCVSVLDNEAESRKQLEASVDAMVARITSDDPVTLDQEAERLEKERGRLISDLSASRRALIDARQDEYRDLIVAGAQTQPSDAARFVAHTAQQNAWIPGPLEAGAPAPLSDKEVKELYGTNGRVDPDIEIELRRWRSPAGDAVGADEFANQCERWRMLEQSDKSTGARFWSEGFYEATSEELALIHERIRDSVDLLSNAPGWKLDAVAAGLAGSPESVPWEELASRLDRLRSDSQPSLGLLLDSRCTLSTDISPEVQRGLAAEIRSHVEHGGKLGPFRSWQSLPGESSLGPRG